MTRLFRFFCAIVFIIPFIGALEGLAQPIVSFRGDRESLRWDDEVEIFIDSTLKLTFTDVQQPLYQAKFKSKSERSLTFGYLPYTVWLRTSIAAPVGNVKEWYLEIPAPFLEYVDFHQKTAGGWQTTSMGYYVPHALRPVKHTGFALPLQFDSSGQTTVYVRIAGDSPKTFPLYVIEREAFLEKNRKEDLGYGIFFGIMGVMFFFNLIIGLTLRQTNYLLYVGTIFCSFLIFSTASGYSGQYLWPNRPEMNFWAGRMILGVFVTFLALFAIYFLETKKYAKGLHYLLLSLIALAGVATVLVASGIVPSALNSLLSVTAVVLVISGLTCRVRGNRVAGYFIAAWMFYLLGGLALLLRNAGVFEFNFWTTHLPEIGACLETVIIAFALADQYRIFKEQKEQAQQLAIKIQQETNERLEQTVAERTKEMSSTVEELNSLLEENKKNTGLIQQKNEELDAFFYGVSHDLKSPIASLLSLTALAREEVRDTEARTYFDMQERELNRLNAIVSDLISITKLDHESVEQEWIDFQKLVDDCLLAFRSLPNYERFEFIRDIAPGIRFKSEWIFVNNILQNLVENAIKYAQPANPYVKISVQPKDQGVIIQVTDNGIGIAAEHVNRIFDMFYRATGVSNGTGLGLFILKRSVSRLGGSVTVSSEPGKGSVFTVTLP